MIGVGFDKDPAVPVISAATLKDRHRQIRDSQSENARTRLHRAISWLARSEAESADADACFIFQWVALNAAYAREFSRDENERERFRAFTTALVQLDARRSLHQALFEQFTGPIRTLIDNKFVFEPFWAAMREHDSSGQWERQFAASRKSRDRRPCSAAKPLSCLASSLIGCTCCATSSCTAAPPGTAASTANN
jgi:hypothetical protein